MLEASLCGTGPQTWRTWAGVWRTCDPSAWGRVRRSPQPAVVDSRQGKSVAYLPGATGVKLGASLVDRSNVNVGTVRSLPFPHPSHGCGG